jgi:[protein-PII] uridylyltransferase
LDIFNLEPPAKPRLTTAIRIQNIYRKWRLLSTEETTADALVMERLRKYPPDPLRTISPPPPVRVLVDNISSPLYTILEIDTPDNFGLLYKIAHCFSECKINIVSARLSTRVDQAVDVFYINDGEKQKITKEDQIESLKGILLNTLSI